MRFQRRNDLLGSEVENGALEPEEETETEGEMQLVLPPQDIRSLGKCHCTRNFMGITLPIYSYRTRIRACNVD